MIRRVRPLAIALAALVLSIPAAGADLRRLESVGVVPIDEDGSGRSTHRDRAVGAAVARAVERVAGDALAEGPPREAPDERGRPDPGQIAPELVPALGSDPFEFATRFRILEDRGIRPALLSGPGVDEEYVVLVEVFVDASRIGERLTAAGWREDPAGSQATRVRVVLEGLRSFRAYDALRRALLDELNVRSAIPVELTRGRAILEVDSDYDSEALLAALVRSTEPGLRVVPVDRADQTLTVLVEWTPPLAPAEGADSFGEGHRR